MLELIGYEETMHTLEAVELAGLIQSFYSIENLNPTATPNEYAFTLSIILSIKDDEDKEACYAQNLGRYRLDRPPILSEVDGLFLEPVTLAYAKLIKYVQDAVKDLGFEFPIPEQKVANAVISTVLNNIREILKADRN